MKPISKPGLFSRGKPQRVFYRITVVKHDPARKALTASTVVEPEVEEEKKRTPREMLTDIVCQAFPVDDEEGRP